MVAQTVGAQRTIKATSSAEKSFSVRQPCGATVERDILVVKLNPGKRPQALRLSFHQNLETASFRPLFTNISLAYDPTTSPQLLFLNSHIRYRLVEV